MPAMTHKAGCYAEFVALPAEGLAPAPEKADTIAEEMIAVQGKPAELGGYFRPDADKTSAVMRPSETLNGIIAKLG